MEALRNRVWQQRGVVSLHLEDITDPWLHWAIQNEAVRRSAFDPEPPRKAVKGPGDLWLPGEHRLLCGVSTDAASVARVTGGDRAALLLTSPPYGNQRDYTTGGVTDHEAELGDTGGDLRHLRRRMRAFSA